MLNVDKIFAELRRPAAKRTMGHDRDPAGFLVLVASIPDDVAEARFEEILAAELPGKIDCLTCRFAGREWAGEPCWSCLDGYTSAEPYPKWRRA